MRSRKGIYAIIGTFIFIAVAVGIAIGLIWQGSFLAGMEEAIHSSTSRADVADDVKEKLLYCYGTNGIIDREKLSGSCDVHYDYNLSVRKYGSCVEETLKTDIKEHKKDKVVFSIPVTGEDGVSICPGRLDVFI